MIFFLAYDFSVEGPNSAGRNFKKDSVARDAQTEKNLALRKGRFGHKESALWNEGIREPGLD